MKKILTFSFSLFLISSSVFAMSTGSNPSAYLSVADPGIFATEKIKAMSKIEAIWGYYSSTANGTGVLRCGVKTLGETIIYSTSDLKKTLCWKEGEATGMAPPKANTMQPVYKTWTLPPPVVEFEISNSNFTGAVAGVISVKGSDSSTSFGGDDAAATTVQGNVDFQANAPTQFEISPKLK